MGLSTKRSPSANSLATVRCMADKPKITYFNARGVAETARIMYVAAGVDYEDFRYQMVPQAPGQMPVMTASLRLGQCIYRYCMKYKTAWKDSFLDTQRTCFNFLFRKGAGL
jgi:hypothetical protein